MRDKLNLLLAQHQHLSQTVSDEKRSLKLAQYQVEIIEKAQILIQMVAQRVQSIGHQKISRIVTRCLSAVFEDPVYEFKIEFERKYGKTTARLLFIQDEKEMDPNSSGCGSALQVASLALRQAEICLSRPQKRKLLILDEPFTGLDRDNKTRLQELLVALTEEMETQVIMCTHDESFKELGNVIDLDQIKDKK